MKKWGIPDGFYGIEGVGFGVVENLKDIEKYTAPGVSFICINA